jgi:hypothetical protein
VQDKELSEKLLGLNAPWSVLVVDLQMIEMKVMVLPIGNTKNRQN